MKKRLVFGIKVIATKVLKPMNIHEAKRNQAGFVILVRKGGFPRFATQFIIGTGIKGKSGKTL